MTNPKYVAFLVDDGLAIPKAFDVGKRKCV